MTVFVKNYVMRCAVCQQMKVNTHPSSPGLIPIKEQENATPFSQVTCDFITDLPETEGFDSLMVVVDHGSIKGVISIPCNKTIDATLTAQNYIDHVYRCFGLSNSFLSDRGPQFSFQVFREMAWLLGIKTLRSTAYHPQTDGETEWVNQELEIYFRIFCSNNLKMWKQLNPLMEFSHNQKVHSTTKQTPFYLMMGYEQQDISLAFEKTNAPTAEQWITTLKKARNEATVVHELVRQMVAERTTRGFTPFKKRRTGVAWQPEPKDRLPIQKASPEKRRTLHDNRSLGTSDLSPTTSKLMANSWYFPCITFITLSWNWRLWSELHETTSWPYRRRRRIQNRSDHESQEMG